MLHFSMQHPSPLRVEHTQWWYKATTNVAMGLIMPEPVAVCTPKRYEATTGCKGHLELASTKKCSCALQKEIPYVKSKKRSHSWHQKDKASIHSPFAFFWHYELPQNISESCTECQNILRKGNAARLHCYWISRCTVTFYKNMHYSWINQAYAHTEVKTQWKLRVFSPHDRSNENNSDSTAQIMNINLQKIKLPTSLSAMANSGGSSPLAPAL